MIKRAGGMKTVARSVVKQLLRKAGHAYPCEDYLNKYVFGYHLAKLFKRLDIRCVIDVGGHQGGYGHFLRTDVGYSGLIISFEPALENLSMLRKRAERDGNWMVLGLALGDEITRREMNVMKLSVFNSFLEPTDSAVSDFRLRNAVVQREMVEMQTLDAIFERISKERGIERPYLKIDTQGFDFRVLQGAQRVLGKFLGVQVEASVKPLYVGAVPFTEVFEYLRARGFELTGMFPVVRDEKLRLVEFDLVMARGE